MSYNKLSFKNKISQVFIGNYEVYRVVLISDNEMLIQIRYGNSWYPHVTVNGVSRKMTFLNTRNKLKELGVMFKDSIRKFA